MTNPDYRNQGMAQTLIKKLIEIGKERNIAVQLFCKEGVIGFYEKLGFKQNE